MKLRKKLKYCNRYREKIRKKAMEVYMLGIEEKSRKRFNICDFKKIEEKCLKYMKLKK